jgi:DNA-binding CsgD family transcriptional regulator
VIHRDNLRYTDDVIATLQSSNPLWYIANALDISVEDVHYHYGEVFDLNHNGTVLPLRETPEPAHLLNRYGGTIRQYRTTQVYPQQREYYAERTATQVAAEIGKTVDSVRTFCGKRGFTLKRAIMGIRKRTDWPTNPAWYAQRTIIEAAKELNLAATTVRKYAQEHKFKMRPNYRFVEWPTDRAWFEARTAVQVAKELITNEDSVRAHCRKRGIKLRSGRAVVSWPKDAQWYAERTLKQIACELDVQYHTVAQHVHMNKIKYKRVKVKSKST